MAGVAAPSHRAAQHSVSASRRRACIRGVSIVAEVGPRTRRCRPQRCDLGSRSKAVGGVARAAAGIPYTTRPLRLPPLPKRTMSLNPPQLEEKKGIDIKELILLDTNQFCALARISIRTAFEWRRDQIIPFVRIQSRVYYRLSDVCALMERSTLKKLNKN